MKLDDLFKSKIGEQREDETFIDGLPYCKKCGGARFVELGDGEDYEIHRCACKCQSDGWESLEREKKQQEDFDKFRDRQKASMLGERYLNAGFETANITKNNERAYEIAKKYVKDAETMKRFNIGMYVYGKNGVGKTHLIACMCNELVKNGYRCMYTSIQGIITLIQKTYNKGESSEDTIIEMLSSVDFLFIDDMAKELMKGQVQGSFAEKVLFQVINGRYNNKKPTIFTSNFSLSEIIEIGLDNSINSRILEMANISIEMKGCDLRKQLDKEKVEVIKNIVEG